MYENLPFFLIKPDNKEICKNVKPNATLLIFFVLENRAISYKYVIYVSMQLGLSLFSNEYEFFWVLFSNTGNTVRLNGKKYLNNVHKCNRSPETKTQENLFIDKLLLLLTNFEWSRRETKEAMFTLLSEAFLLVLSFLFYWDLKHGLETVAHSGLSVFESVLFACS